MGQNGAIVDRITPYTPALRASVVGAASRPDRCTPATATLPGRMGGFRHKLEQAMALKSFFLQSRSTLAIIPSNAVAPTAAVQSLSVGRADAFFSR